MPFKFLKKLFNKKSEAVEAGVMLGGESVITEFAVETGKFQDHSGNGYVGQATLPLRQTYSARFAGENRDFSFFVYIWMELLRIVGRRKTGSAYGYYRQFIKCEIFNERKHALMASVGMAKRIDVMSKDADNFILCHVVPNELRPGTNVEVWTVTDKKVSSIHSYRGLPVNKNAFLNEFHDALDNHKLQNNLRSHSVYIYGDSVLGFEDNQGWPITLLEGFYQLPESELYKSAVDLPLINKKENGKNASIWPLIASFAILAAGPAFVIGANSLYEKRFDAEKQVYIDLTKKVEGLDEYGRNSAQVAIWEARDTYLRQQGTKSLDTDNLELIGRAVSSAASTQQSRIIVKTIDYSRTVKHRQGIPSYHFRLELLIKKSQLVSEGEAVDIIYSALGSAMADVTEEFVTPGNPKTTSLNGQEYYRVEFVGRFEANRVKGGFDNA